MRLMDPWCVNQHQLRLGKGEYAQLVLPGGLGFWGYRNDRLSQECVD
jgi:hypothetical protein